MLLLDQPQLFLEIIVRGLLCRRGRLGLRCIGGNVRCLNSLALSASCLRIFGLSMHDFVALAILLWQLAALSLLRCGGRCRRAHIAT